MGDDEGRLHAQRRAVTRGERSPRRREDLDELDQVDELAPSFGSPPGGRGREIVQGAARARQLELDRSQAHRLAAETVQAELHGGQRPAQLVAGACDEHEPLVRAQVERDEREGHRPARGREDHALHVPRRRSRAKFAPHRPHSALPVHQPVADAPDVDHEPVPVPAQLLPQPAGVRVERAGRSERPEAPHLAQQLLLREHARRCRGERPQQRELLRRQRDPVPAQRRRPCHGVDLEFTDAQQPAMQPRARAPQHGRDPQPQLVVRERLRHVVVDAALEPAHAVELARAAGEHDERQRRVDPRADAVRRADAPDQLEARAVREPEVDHREVRRA